MMMTKVLVLGAAGQIARQAIPMLDAAGAQLTLYARDASRVQAPAGARVVEADVKDEAALADALAGQDVVYANLGADLDVQAGILVEAMGRAGVSRLIFVDALGIYDELPPAFNAWNQSMIGEPLKVFRRAADTVEASGLEWTILRPAWLTDADEVDYELTGREETFRGTEVSRKSVAAFIAELAAHPQEHIRENLGLGKPGTDGDKPSWY